MTEKKWEELLKLLDIKIDEERKIWSTQLKGKIDELRTFKEEMLKLQKSPTQLLRSREERLRGLETRLENERQYLQKEEIERKEVEENLRLAQKKLGQLEKENEYFRKQLTDKANDLNELRIKMGPHLVNQSMEPGERIKYFEDKVQETENFYKRISGRIDKLLKKF